MVGADSGRGNETHPRPIQQRGITTCACAHNQCIGITHSFRGYPFWGEESRVGNPGKSIAYIGDMRFDYNLRHDDK